MNLYLNAKSGGSDGTQPAKSEAKGDLNVASVGSGTEKPRDRDEVAGRASLPSTCLSMPSDKATCHSRPQPMPQPVLIARRMTTNGNEPENWEWVFDESGQSPGRVEDLTDLQVPQALGRKPDRHPSRESDLPGRKLSVQDAAHFLNLSASTLNKMRLSGTGPPYMKPCRRVVYDVRDLEAWAASRKRNHTSEQL